MIQVTSPLMPKLERYTELLKEIWDNKWLTNNGPLLIRFQEELQKYLGNQVELFTNGHMALDLAIKGLGLQGEVITTPYTFASTTHALVMNNCTPVFCDICPDDYTIDADQIEQLITEKTTAIMPVHVYGCICQLEKIQKIADRYGLKVIYDAAHAFGIQLKDHSIFDYGTASMISFHATKVFNSIEGGALVFAQNDEFARKVRNLRNFGIESEESVTSVGLNAKMNEFSAAMGLCNLEIVEEAIQRRKVITQRYESVLQDMPGIRMLDYKNIEKRGIKYNYAYFPIEVDPQKAGYDRNMLAQYLQKKGIGVRKYFYPLITDFECYHNMFDQADIPVAKRVSDRILTLPLAPSMTDDDVEKVCLAMIAAEKECD